MRHTEIIKTIMRKKGVKLEDLAFSLGLATASGVGQRINRKNGTIMNTAEILEALDYEMVIRKAKKEPLAENEYVLRSRDYYED
jgi:hypothetical protein